MKIKGFTLTELVVAMVVLAIIASASIPLTKSKLAKIEKFSYYMAYNSALDISRNVMSIFDYQLNDDNTLSIAGDGPKTQECIKDQSLCYEFSMPAFCSSHPDICTNRSVDFIKMCDNYGLHCNTTVSPEELTQICDVQFPDACQTVDNILCDKLANTFNIYSKSCAIPMLEVNTIAASDTPDFADLTPHIGLSSGLNLYIASRFHQINMFQDEPSIYDRWGFDVYIDSNGTRNGEKDLLFIDVYPFYLLASGKVVPGFGQGLAAPVNGANNEKLLSFNVHYDDYTSGSRIEKLLLSAASFRVAACTTGYVKASRYCLQNGEIRQNDVCRLSQSDCRFDVNKPFLGLFK